MCVGNWSMRRLLVKMIGGSQPSNKTRFRDTAAPDGGQRWAIRRDQRNYDNDIIEHEMIILFRIQRSFPGFTC